MNSRELFLYDRAIKPEVIVMVYRNLMISTAAFMLVLGALFVLLGPRMLPYLGGISWAELAQPPLPARSAIPFTRLFGVMLLIVGLIASMACKLDRPEDQRSIGLAFFMGGLSLSIVALTQQIAVWATTTGWFLVVMIVSFTFSFGYVFFVQLGGADFRSLTLSQDPEKLRQRWVRQLSEAAAQQERNRLARDLHDSIKQQIFSINVSAAAAQERWASDGGGAHQAIEDVRNSAREAMIEMEAMLQQLRPAPLENTGLVEALRKQAEALQYRTGAQVTTEFGDLPDNDTLWPGAQEAIFRIAQETLNNIARHARAKNVHLRLYQQHNGENPALWLKIEDDGSGFDTTQSGAGMGLANINARAAEIGGHLQIESAPGEGTSLVMSIPIISPDVSNIRRRYYANQAYTFIAIMIIGILGRRLPRTGDMTYGIYAMITAIMLLLPTFIHAIKEKGLLEKLKSANNVALKISLGLTRDSYQALFFFYLCIISCSVRRVGFLFVICFGVVLWGHMSRIHRVMKELKEQLSAIDFKQSAEQMWRQAIITLTMVTPLVVALFWWTHESQPLLFIPLSALYLGYVVWWRYRGYSRTRQGA